MISRLMKKMRKNISAAIVLLCLISYVSLISCTIYSLHTDFNEKYALLAGQYTKCLETKFDSLKNSYTVFINDNIDAVLSGNLSSHDVNVLLNTLIQGNANIFGASIVTKDTRYYSDAYYSGTGLYGNFGEDAYNRLKEQIFKPTYMINKFTSPSYNNDRMICIIPVTCGDEQSFLLIFFDPFVFMQNFYLEKNIFIKDSCIIMDVNDGGYFQLKTRLSELPVNKNRLCGVLPRKRVYEHIIHCGIPDYGFDVMYYKSDLPLILQDIYIVLFSLVPALIIILPGLRITKQFTSTCNLRLNNLIHTMDNYASGKKDGF